MARHPTRIIEMTLKKMKITSIFNRIAPQERISFKSIFITVLFRINVLCRSGRLPGVPALLPESDLSTGNIVADFEFDPALFKLIDQNGVPNSSFRPNGKWAQS
jgi:hypothetical protein